MTPAVLTADAAQSLATAAQLSRRIANILDLNTLLADVVQILSRDFGYTYTSLFLSDLNETTLTLKAAAGFNIPPTQHLSWPINTQTSIGRAALAGESVLVNQPGPATALDYWPFTPQSEIAAPLMVSKQVLGVLHTQSEHPATYQPSDLYLLEIVAGQVASAIENSRLSEERDRRMAELIAFNQIGIFIAEQNDLQTIFTNITYRIAALFQVEAVSLLLLEKDQLRFVAATGAGAESVKSFTLKPGQGIAWSVVESGRPLRVDDVKRDTRHFSGIDAAIHFTTHSLLAVPILLQERVLGVIEAINPLDGRPFNQADEVTLEFIVSSVAIAIENTRLFGQIQRHVNQVEGLLEASRTLNTLDLQAILDTIVQQISVLLQADQSVVYLADYQARQLKPTAVHSSREMARVSTPAFEFDQGTVGWVFNHRQPLRINDVTHDPRFALVSPESHLIANLMSIPLIVKGEAIGVLEATHKSGGDEFSEDDEALLSAFASQAAVAIHNARLHRATEQQVRALTILTQASQNITKAANLEHLLNTVLDFALSVIGGQTGVIALTDPETETLHIEAGRGISKHIIDAFNQSKISYHHDAFGEIYRTRNIVEITNGVADMHPTVPPEMMADIPQSFIIVPLFSRNEFIGVMLLHTLPDEDARALIKAIADMAAVAIDKARLFKETNQRLAEVSTLYTLADQVTKALEVEQVAESSVVILQHALDCSGCCLFLKPKAEGEPLILKAYSGWPEGRSDNAEMAYITQLARTLTAKPSPFYIPNMAETLAIDPDGLSEWAGLLEQTHLQLGSVMMMPLIVKDELLGALAINDMRPQAFGEAEGRLLTIAAAQISTAIQNSILYDNLEQRASELEKALKQIEAAHLLQTEFVENVSHELRTPLTFIKAYITLVLEGDLGEVPAVIKDKLEIILHKTDAIIHLVEDLVTLQKVEASKLRVQTIGAHELITRAVQSASASAAEHQIQLVANSTPHLPKVRVNIDRIGQVFDNLVGNALKFSPAGSKIILTAAQEGDHVKFSVQDFGMGIPADKLDKVFERFYQIDKVTTRHYGGAGLGLTIVKQIIEAHGGQIKVESEVSKGATFSFWLAVDHEK